MKKLWLHAAFLVLLGACGGAENGAVGSGTDSIGGNESDEALTVQSVPDPCEWLSPAEAREILQLDQEPAPVRMGTRERGARACIYMNADRTKWINVSHDLINPQIFDPTGKSLEELVELAGTTSAYEMEHLYSGMSEGVPVVAFGNDERTTLIAYSGIGIERDLPEGFPEGHSISSYINPLLVMAHPSQTHAQELAVLQGLVDRPLAQLRAAAANAR